MPLAIALYVAAAAAAVGGPWVGKTLFDRAQQERASATLRRDREHVKEALHDEIELAELRKQAEANGVDPDLVEQGYQALRDGSITWADLRKIIDS